ncbi:MAG: hypothetical protein ACRDRS_09545 [Pseudonocardiaceae bacterium]
MAAQRKIETVVDVPQKLQLNQARESTSFTMAQTDWNSMADSPSDMGVATVKDAVEILDCTLRDGSYSVDFQFTERTICSVLTALEACGIRFIELGHGLGLNAAVALVKPTLVADERCFEIAQESLLKADWGMFCIPGIAKKSHLRHAGENGMKFVRIGVNITEVEAASEFVGLAKELGMMAFVNLMKTSLLDGDRITSTVQKCVTFGADVVYLVDSVGGFLPCEVGDIFARVGRSVDVPLGFHGHDNMGLANANSLAAVSGGATYVDTTLDGIGRGAGNSSTEAFAAILRKLGMGSKYDYANLAHLSEDEIRPLLRLHDDRFYQLVGALTQTHSSYFPFFRECAAKTNIDVVDLMEAVAEVDRVDPTEELVMAIAKSLAQR